MDVRAHDNGRFVFRLTIVVRAHTNITTPPLWPFDVQHTPAGCALSKIVHAVPRRRCQYDFICLNMHTDGVVYRDAVVGHPAIACCDSILAGHQSCRAADQVDERSTAVNE